MTTQQAPPEDAALLLRARSGDGAAIESLYAAYYDAGRRFAISLAGADAADDLAADVWTKVLGLLQAGRGPQDNFRAYLFTSIRNRFYDKMRIAGRERPASDEPWLLDDITPPSDDIIEEYDDADAVAALESLPARWQKMLWQLEVEGRSVPEVAALHDIDTAAVSSAAYRAREGLRTAYLDQQINGHMHADDRECAWVRQRMSKFVRATTSTRASERIEAHALVCTECEGILVRLQSTNRKFGLLLLPILLVGAGGTKAAALWGGAAGLTAGIGVGWGRVWGWVRSPGGSVVTAATIFALAGPGAIWATAQQAPPPVPEAVETVETPASPTTIPPPVAAQAPPAAPPPAIDEQTDEADDAVVERVAQVATATTVATAAPVVARAAARSAPKPEPKPEPARTGAKDDAKPLPMTRGKGKKAGMDKGKKVGFKKMAAKHPGKVRARAKAHAKGKAKGGPGRGRGHR